MNTVKLVNVNILGFNKVYKKSIFNFFKKNTLNNKTEVNKYPEKNNREKIIEKNINQTDINQDNLNDYQKSDKTTNRKFQIKESKINKYFRDDIKKYDGRLN